MYLLSSHTSIFCYYLLPLLFVINGYNMSISIKFLLFGILRRLWEQLFAILICWLLIMPTFINGHINSTVRILFDPSPPRIVEPAILTVNTSKSEQHPASHIFRRQFAKDFHKHSNTDTVSSKHDFIVKGPVFNSQK